MKEIVEALLRELRAGRAAVLVTIIEEKGSTPRGAGARMLVGAEGRIVGTVGGGSVEFNAEQKAKSLLQEKSSALHDFKLYVNSTEDIGMVCGGDVRLHFHYAEPSPEWIHMAEQWLALLQNRTPGVLIQRFEGGMPTLLSGDGSLLAGVPCERMPAEAGVTDTAFGFPVAVPERALIFGAGHVSAALAPVLHGVGFQVVVLDCRPELLSTEKFPTAEQMLPVDYENIAGTIEIRDTDYVVVMTNGHSFDYAVERQVLPVHPAYLGVIGSHRKIAAVNAKLTADGFSQAQLDTVHTPIGLPIGAVTPAEIAISITAEMIQIRAERNQSAGMGERRGCPMH